MISAGHDIIFSVFEPLFLWHMLWSPGRAGIPGSGRSRKPLHLPCLKRGHKHSEKLLSVYLF